MQQQNNYKNCIVSPLNTPVDCAVLGVDNTLYVIHKGTLYTQACNDNFFKVCYSFENKATGMILNFDKAGNLYCAMHGDGILYKSHDQGRSFSPCLINKDCLYYRGFTLGEAGEIYLAGYTREGPAILYKGEEDGDYWDCLFVFNARHIHDIALNRWNGWMYVVCGEGSSPYLRHRNIVFRSMDNGETFFPVVRPTYCIDEDTRPRPLFLSVACKENLVVLGTDHPEGDNGLYVFEDTGEMREYGVKRVLTFPDIRFIPGRAYPWKILTCGDRLFTCIAGASKSLLFSSADGKNWEQECDISSPEASSPAQVGRLLEIMPFGRKFMLSGQQEGFIVCVKESEDEGDSCSATVTPDIALLCHDSRFSDKFCKGFFYRSLKQVNERTSLALELLEQAGLDKDSLIVDCGCGVGNLLIMLHERGYTRLHGTEANPRWIIAARRMFEACYGVKIAPTFHIVTRKNFSIPEELSECDCITLLNVLVGNGNGVSVDKAFEISFKHLRAGGIFICNIQPDTYKKEDVTPFLNKLATTGFTNIIEQKHQFNNVTTYFISCKKALNCTKC